MFYTVPIIGKYSYNAQSKFWSTRIVIDGDTRVIDVNVTNEKADEKNNDEIKFNIKYHNFGKSIMSIIEVDNLLSGSHYTVQLVNEQNNFELCYLFAPENGSKVKYFLLSCDGYNSYPDYKFNEKEFYENLKIKADNKTPMWEKIYKDAYEETKNNNFCQFIHLGDQVYLDSVVAELLKLYGQKELSEEEKINAIELMKNEYRKTFNKPYTRDTYKHFSHLMILDDHEIIDDWKSLKTNWQNQTITKSISDCCLYVYKMYQHSLFESPDNLSYKDFRWSYDLFDVKVVTPDLRTYRTQLDVNVEYPMCGSDQFEWITSEMKKDNRDIMLILSSAMVHGGEFQTAMLSKSSTPLADGWASNEDRVRERNEILKLVAFVRETKRVILVSGDSHKSGSYIFEHPNSLRFPYLVSSPISSHPSVGEISKTENSCLNLFLCCVFNAGNSATDTKVMGDYKIVESNTINDYSYCILNMKGNDFTNTDAQYKTYLGFHEIPFKLF